jgi:hypothetical protein
LLGTYTCSLRKLWFWYATESSTWCRVSEEDGRTRIVRRSAAALTVNEKPGHKHR